MHTQTLSTHYTEAFKRNQGLISPEEQERLRQAHVAIAGLGGVGGIDLITLARLGIGHFSIADPDTFEIHNFNRQYGATVSTLGESKADVMAKEVGDINPEAKIRIFKEPITKDNVDEFLKEVDVLVDGIDAFEINTKRLLFKKAKEKGIWALGAGPVGFSTAWTIFDPKGMSYDEYYDFHDGMNPKDLFIHYILGMAPRNTARSYVDISYLDLDSHTGPSASLACQLSAGVVAAEVLKILLRRGRIKPAPYYHQLDPYQMKYVSGKLWFGNRGLIQRLKIFLAKQLILKTGEKTLPFVKG